MPAGRLGLINRMRGPAIPMVIAVVYAQVLPHAAIRNIGLRVR